MAEPDYRSCASAGMAALHRWYQPQAGQWSTAGWWNAANALTVVIAYTKLTGPFDRADAARQSSALDGLIAALALSA